MNARLATALLGAALAVPFAGASAQSAPGAAAVGALDTAAALRQSQAAIGRGVGDQVLLDRQGKPVRLADYRGKPLLVSFVYSGCFQICPTTTRSLADAVAQLSASFGAGKFNVVSIGFNPPFDSPTSMRAFAAQLGSSAGNWEFLSATQASIDALTGTFGFSYVATPAGFDHVLAVSVVDAEGRVAGQVYGDKVSADQLGEPLRRLLREAPLSSGAPLTDLIDRVRILCTVYDPETGTYRTDWGLILEIAGGLTFALSMACFFGAEWRSQRRARRAVREPSHSVSRP
jgi:protein SCO1/2